MSVPPILYRGVSIKMFKGANGHLVPKVLGKEFDSEVCCGDPHAEAGSGMQAGFPTSGHSTTPHKSRAKVYATPNNEPGLIFSFCTQSLQNKGVSIFRVKDYVQDPCIPEDDEYILVTEESGMLDLYSVIDIERV